MGGVLRQALVSSLVFLRGLKGGKAEAYVENLAKEGRYHQDVWSS